MLTISKNKTVSTSTNSVDPIYASFWVRLAAVLIDALIIGATGYLVILIMQTTKQKSIFIEEFIQFMIGISYYIFYQAYDGQTIGKKLLRIKVVNELGETPSVFVFLLREIVGKTISGLTLGLGYLWMFWDPKKQTLHDKIARTYVIKV